MYISHGKTYGGKSFSKKKGNHVGVAVLGFCFVVEFLFLGNHDTSNIYVIDGTCTEVWVEKTLVNGGECVCKMEKGSNTLQSLESNYLVFFSLNNIDYCYR